jgi:transcription elongation GreA/GreB family factor
MTLKQQIHAHYLQLVNTKIQHLRQILADLKESGTNETKSTAGDKHETALAMLQIEQANTRAQLKEVLDQKAILEKINPGLTTVQIVNGSLVKTNRGWLYVSTALGKVSVANITVTALSPQSPLGIKLMGLKVSGITAVNNNEYIVESIE